MKTKKDLKLKWRGATRAVTGAEKDARFVAIRDGIGKRLKGRSASGEHHGSAVGKIPEARIVGLRKRAARVDPRA